MKNHVFPSFKYIVEGKNNLNLKPFSKLKAYGYTVRQVELSDKHRQELLMKIIDRGLMTKQEIILNLEFKVSYNGKLDSNWRAKRKWENDIKFVSTYTLGNKRCIAGEITR